MFLLPTIVLPFWVPSSSLLTMGAFKITYHVELFALIVCMGIFAFHSVIITLILLGNGGWTVEFKEHMRILVMLFCSMILLDLTFLGFLLYLLTSLLSSSIGKDKLLSCSALQRKLTEQSEHGEESNSVNDVCVEKHKFVAKIIPKTVEVPKVSSENQYESSLMEHNLGKAETSFYSELDVHQTELVQPPITTSSSQAIQLDKDENLAGISEDTSFIPRTKSMESNEENVKVGTGSEVDQMISPSVPIECSTTLPSMMHECKKSTVMSMGAGDGSGKEATSGLNQRAKRKLAAILGEFWGLFFDTYGKLTEEAKWMRVDMLLDLVLDPSPELNMSTSIAEHSSPKSSLAGDKLPVLSAVPTVSNTSPTLLSVSAELPYLVVMESPSWLSTQQSLNHEPIENIHGYATPSNNGGFGSHGNTDVVGPALAGSYFTNYGNQFSYIPVQNGYGLSFSGGLYYYVAPRSYHEPSSSGTNFFWNYAPQYGAVCTDSLFSVHKCEHWSDTFPYANLQDLNVASGTEEDHLASVAVSTGAHYEDDSSQSMHDCKTSKTKLPENYLPPSRVAMTWGGLSITSETGTPKEFLSFRETECLLVRSLRLCIRKIIGLEGSGWLFGQSGGCDEELIDYFAATEKLLDKDNPLKGNAAPMSEEGGQTISLSILPYCGAGCILQARLVVSFAVWCIHRILDLLLVESRPEHWGRFTHVLNLLQGILDPAFCKTRQAIFPCKCLEPPEAVSPIKESPGKAPLTSGRFILELIKNVKNSISRRRGQKGTGAANIAFPMGKKNLTSVFKRYNRLLNSSS